MVASPEPARTRAVRTCIGCRSRATASQLVRVVVVDGVCVLDHRSRLPGRGAHLHPTRSCLDLAERRRAFPRALQSPGTLDLTAVRAWVEQVDAILLDADPAQERSTRQDSTTTQDKNPVQGRTPSREAGRDTR